MAAFVATAWITIFTSSIAMMHSWPRIYKTSPRLVHLSLAAESLLGPLCDLQVITGGAILVAGFSQYYTITFYHRELVVAYWWLTWNSFWSSRSAYMYNALDTLDSSWSKWRVYARRMLVTISVALGIIYLSLSIQLETSTWNTRDPKRCYNYSDPTYDNKYNSLAWFWIAGLGLYEFTLVLSFVDTEARFATAYNKGFQTFVKMLHHSAANHYANIPDISPKLSQFGALISRLQCYCTSVLLWLLFIFFWLLRQLMSVWTYGHDRTVFFCVFSCLVGGWNTFDVFMLKIMNARLVDAGEKYMGYGQILPVFILLQIPLFVLDIWKGESISGVLIR